MIGFFDSGFGGLTIIKEIRNRLPNYSTVYLGDNARTPYGSLPPAQIYRYTLEGVTELFRRGAELIILACNTSSSVALRRIQQEYLPANYPDKRVLGIVIPTAEEVSRRSQTKVIGILATEATVASVAYPQEIYKIDSNVRVYQQACPLLVPMIESGEFEDMGAVLNRYIERLLQQNSDIDTILLGCTHYALIRDTVSSLTPPRIRVLSQGEIVAEKLADYLKRHPEIEARLQSEGAQSYLSSENGDRIQRLGTQFYGAPIVIESIRLGA